MNLDDYFYLGHFAKTYGVKGELILYLDVDDSSAYLGLNSFFLKEDGTLLPYFIDQLSEHGRSRFRVRLEDVDTLEAAEALLKKDIYLPLSALPELGETQFYFHEVAGYTAVNNESGNALGKIEGVMDLPGNPLLQVNNDANEILIPINDETIAKVDRGNNTIYVMVPEGLLDLYLEDSDPEEDQ